MKFPGAPSILIDEFPQPADFSNIEVIILTRPFYWKRNYPVLADWPGKIVGPRLALKGLELLQAPQNLVPAKLNRWFIIVNALKKKTLARCQFIPHGNPNGSCALLIEKQPNTSQPSTSQSSTSRRSSIRILYATRFVESDKMLANPAVLEHPIDELYIDNKFAGADVPKIVAVIAEHINLIRGMVQEIAEKLTNGAVHSKLRLQLPMIGCEDLLVLLARRHKLKVQILQKHAEWVTANDGRYIELFDFDGHPDVTLQAYEDVIEQPELEAYKHEHRDDHIFTIKLVPGMKYAKNKCEIIGAMDMVYNHHPDSNVIKKLLSAIKPKIVHALYSQRSPNDAERTIPREWLPANCILNQPLDASSQVSSTQDTDQGDIGNLDQFDSVSHHEQQRPSEACLSAEASNRTSSSSLSTIFSRETNGMVESNDDQADEYVNPDFTLSDDEEESGALAAIPEENDGDRSMALIDLGRDAPQNCIYDNELLNSASPLLLTGSSRARRLERDAVPLIVAITGNLNVQPVNDDATNGNDQNGSELAAQMISPKSESSDVETVIMATNRNGQARQSERDAVPLIVAATGNVNAQPDNDGATNGNGQNGSELAAQVISLKKESSDVEFVAVAEESPISISDDEVDELNWSEVSSQSNEASASSVVEQQAAADTNQPSGTVRPLLSQLEVVRRGCAVEYTDSESSKDSQIIPANQIMNDFADLL